MTIEEYNGETGYLKLTEPLPNYHYGASQSTAGDYNGVDIRGEVLLLDRKIKLIGTDTDDWGCQFVTTNVLISTDPLEFAEGLTILKNVEIEKGG
jgi:hypothetical protein